MHRKGGGMKKTIIIICVLCFAGVAWGGEEIVVWNEKDCIRATIEKDVSSELYRVSKWKVVYKKTDACLQKYANLNFDNCLSAPVCVLDGPAMIFTSYNEALEEYWGLMKNKGKRWKKIKPEREKK